MTSGIPYDSDEGRAICRRPHRDHDRRRLCHLGRNGRRARRLPRLRAQRASTCCASSATIAAPPMASATATRSSSVTPVPLDHADAQATQALVDARHAPPGTSASSSARSTATATPRPPVIAPTGTIGLVMDCDTTGIEPDFALVKFKKLAGGGYFKIINRAVPEALRTLGYAESADRRDRGLCRRPRQSQPGARRQPGDADAPRASPTRRSPRSTPRSKPAFDIKFVFNKWTLGADFLTETLRLHRRAARRLRLRPAAAPRLLARRTSRPPTSMSAAR